MCLYSVCSIHTQIDAGTKHGWRDSRPTVGFSFILTDMMVQGSLFAPDGNKQA